MDKKVKLTAYCVRIYSSIKLIFIAIIYVGGERICTQAILGEQADDLFALEITYHAEKALTMLGLLCTQHQQFDKFVALAKEMGTRHWERITTMSEMAEKNQRPELALAVYEAALQPGYHEEYLREKYNALKKRIESS
ncbi:MAG: hypothetical protein ACPGWR_08270 [Ardenticatenaceae bacterium]